MSFSLEHHLFDPTSYRKARPASVSSTGFHSQRRRITYSQPSPTDNLETFIGDMTRRSEKQILQALNDRFAGYIDTVRHLEMHNHNLEAEAAALRQSQAGRASIWDQYEQELEELRSLLQTLTGEKASVALENDHLEDEIQRLRARLDEDARNRQEVEAAARAMKKYVDECRLARLELEKKLRALEEEDIFLKKNHEEEVSELLAQIKSAQVSVDVREAQKADITGVLREIRAQLDSRTCESSTHAEEWFQVRLEHLSDAAKSKQNALHGAQQEIAEYRRQLQSRTIELETLRGTKEALDRQHVECEDRHHDDLNSLQETINQLDNELKTIKWEMANQLRDYQELLNVKMALDIEIAAYRKLLEGEENRLVSGGSLYSYMESRISTHFNVKGDEISDTVILEEQTDETQVTEVTEEETEEENQEKEEEEHNGAEIIVDNGEGKEEKEAVKEEEKPELPEKATPPPTHSPQPKSPTAKSLPRSPVVKSPAGDESKSPEEKSSPPKTPEPKSPEREKAKPLVAKDTAMKETDEQCSQPVMDEKKNEQPLKEEEKQESEKTDKPDRKKESKADEAPKSDDTLKPAALNKPTEDKPAAQLESIQTVPAAKEEKTSSIPSPQAKTELEPTPNDEPKPKPTQKAEPEAEPATKTKPEAEPATKAEPQAEPTTKAEPDAKPATKAEPQAEPTTKAEPQAEPTTKAEPQAEPTTKTEPEAKPATKAEPEAKPATKAEPEKAEGKMDDEKSEPKAKPEMTESEKEKKSEEKRETSKDEGKGVKGEKVEKSGTESKETEEK